MSDLHKDVEASQPQTHNTSTSPELTTSPTTSSSIPIATRWIKAEDAERERERSRSRSRDDGKDFAQVKRSSAADPRRSSVASGKALFVDKEKEQRSKVARLLDHHWVPGFLK